MLVQKKTEIILVIMCYLNNYYPTRIFNNQDTRHSVEVGKESKQVKIY